MTLPAFNPPVSLVVTEAQCPKHYKLSREEKQIWKRTAEQLVRLGVLTEADYDALADYARDTIWADSLRAKIRTEGEKIEITNRGGGKSYIRNPAITSLETVLKRLEKFRGSFGLTAIGRTRVKCDAAKADSEKDILDFSKEKL